MDDGLRLDGVVKTYGAVQALRGLDLQAADGELMVLVGPSGCGKTTALRVVAGLEAADRGSVHIRGREATDLPPGERNVSMVFQSYALFPHMSVSENISFGLRARGMTDDEAAKRARTAAAMVGCEELLERKPGELSGGERQRVALARAMVREPDVFLLDEPLSNLDAQLRVDMRTELRRLQRELGTTMLYVTHDQVEALTLGDRVAVLRDGAVEQVGSPDELYQKPATRFVARFVGSPSMNLLSATISDGALRAGPFLLPLPATLDAARAPALEVGLRPEHLQVEGEQRLNKAAAAGKLVEARGEILSVEPAGNETFVHVHSDGHRLVLRSAPDVAARVGDSVTVQADSAAAHVFDVASGRAL